MKITRELHDTCNALFLVIKARDPDLSARALRRDGQPVGANGSPEVELMYDLHSLSDVASSFATGLPPSLENLHRVEAILTREHARPETP